MPYNPIPDYSIKVVLTIDEAAEAAGLEKELKSLEEPFEIYGMNFKASDLSEPKEFEGIAEIFPDALERAAMRAEEQAYAEAWAKEVHSSIEDVLLSIHDVTCEYLGDTESGQQEMVSTDGGIDSVDMKHLDRIELEVKNPHHLINTIVAGVGYFNPPFPIDEKIGAEQFKKSAHNLKDYFDVYGAYKPEPESDRLNPVGDDEYYKEMIAMELDELSEKDAVEALIRLKDESDIDVEEYASKVEKMTEGRIKADALLKEVEPQLKLPLESKMKIKGKNLFQKESKLQERQGKGLEEVYPELDAQVHDAVEEAFQKIERKYETFGPEIEQLEHKSRDGFISSNDGGYQKNGFTEVSMLIGSGYVSSLPDKAEKAVNDQYEYGLQLATEQFKEDYKEELAGIPDEKINYHDLYDMKKGDLAEKLSELENEMNSGDDSTVMFQLRAMFHNDGPENLSFTIQGAVNWEAPYHRPKGQWEAFYEREIEFTEAEVGTIIAKVKEELANAVDFMGA